MLYIMRHGRTDWNDRHKLQGRTDVPLNEEGRRMAEKAAEEYRDIPLDVCWCSPLIRARETAEIVLRGRDVPILTDDRLREMSFGDYEGQENSFGWDKMKNGLIYQYAEAKKLLTDDASYARMAEAKSPYGDGEAARRIVEAILYRYGKRKTPPVPFA